MNSNTNKVEVNKQLQEELARAFPFADFTTSFQKKKDASDFLCMALRSDELPEDLLGSVSRCRDYDKPSWSGGYPYPDFYQVRLSSRAAAEAKADFQLNSDYPSLNRAG